MTGDIQIREFTEDDLDTVFTLIHRVVDFSYREVYPAGALKMYKRYHSRENILHDAKSGYCVVAEDDNGILGTGTLTEDAGIRRVYINPDLQKTGIGSKLYAALEKQAIKNKFQKLGLGASVIARGFWESQGFIFEKEERISTPNNEELVFFLMNKELPV